MTTYAYDDVGRMITATLPSGTEVVSTYSYDNADRLTGISHVEGGSTTLAWVTYTLDDPPTASRVSRRRARTRS